MWLNDLWFGLVTLWLGVVNRIAALALVVGSVFAFLGMGIFIPVDRGTAYETLRPDPGLGRVGAPIPLTGTP